MNELAKQPGPATPKPSRLARLREVLRARDWLGLLFEVLVVTLGVLLAFEIEQWAQQRQRAADERLFLERLHFDYGRAAEEMRSVIAHHDDVIRLFRRAFAARHDPQRLQALAAVQGGCRAGYLGTAPFSDTVFQELISSGKLDRIRDPRLRSKIRDLTTTQAWLKDRADAGREVTRDSTPALIRHQRFEILADGRSTCWILWPELFNDPAAVTAAARTYRMHELVGSGRKDLLRETEIVRKEVGCKLGNPECRR
jgi:hypothetical protein